MSFHVDANLSPRIAQALRGHGHEAVHVVDVDLATATDTEIVAHAEADGFVVVTADTDFPMLLANLATITDDLRRGAIASLGEPPQNPRPATGLTRM